MCLPVCPILPLGPLEPLQVITAPLFLDMGSFRRPSVAMPPFLRHGSFHRDEVVLFLVAPCLVGWAPFFPGGPHSPLPSSPLLRQIKAPGGCVDCFREGCPWGGGELDEAHTWYSPREPQQEGQKAPV